MTPENALHPGAFLQFYLEEMGLNQSQLTRKIPGCTQTKINEICNGKRGISAEMAIYLADALGTTPELWMNAQKNWELSEALKKLGRKQTVPPIAGNGTA